VDNGNKSIRLAAHGSECSTHIHCRGRSDHLPTAHNESVGAYGSDSLNASLWIVVVAGRPPTRE
jgi:hypothetical protein